MTANELHDVSNAEADQAIEFCKKAIPHNELIGRILRNLYKRVQTLEQETATAKKELLQLKQKKGKAKE